jgi:uncharacterized membrane protein HdeD (DUF308 family)
MANDLTAGVHTASTWSVVLSVLMIAAGLLAIGVPLVAGVAVASLVAWLLVLGGVLHLAFAWRGHTAGGVVWEILLGFAYGAIGFYILAHPLVGLESLTLAVAVYLFVEGVLEFILWFQLRTTPAWRVSSSTGRPVSGAALGCVERRRGAHAAAQADGLGPAARASGVSPTM